MAIHATPSCRKPRLHSHPVPYGFAWALTGICFEISWEREPPEIASNNDISAPHSGLNLLWFIRRSSKLPHLMDIRKYFLQRIIFKDGYRSITTRKQAKVPQP